MSGDSPLVALSAIEKRYGQTRALGGAGIELHAGRVHAVVGENGAGKSTLLKIAGGVESADAGRVIVMGSELRPASPREAIRRGVAMVHQHFMLVPTLTGLENLSLGDEPTRMGLLDLSARRAQIEALANDLELPVRLDVPTESLSVGERQRLELLRALRTRPKVLILDEPTAVLAPREAEAVLGLARRLADDGVAVALVTHHLDEVAAWSDEITVLRRGAVVAHHAPGDEAISDVHLIAREALRDVSFLYRPAHLQKVAAILDDPDASNNDRGVAMALLKNAVVASGWKLPMCQDTGTATVVAKKGQRVWTGVRDEEWLSKGIYETYQKENLRYSQTVPLSMFEETNTKSNTKTNTPNPNSTKGPTKTDSSRTPATNGSGATPDTSSDAAAVTGSDGSA